MRITSNENNIRPYNKKELMPTYNKRELMPNNDIGPWKISSSVTSLGTENIDHKYDSIIVESNDIVKNKYKNVEITGALEILFFHANWCRHSTKALYEWNSFLNNNSASVTSVITNIKSRDINWNGYIVRCTEYNCTDTFEIEQKMYDIEHYPSLRVFNKTKIEVPYENLITQEFLTSILVKELGNFEFGEERNNEIKLTDEIAEDLNNNDIKLTDDISELPSYNEIKPTDQNAEDLKNNDIKLTYDILKEHIKEFKKKIIDEKLKKIKIIKKIKRDKDEKKIIVNNITTNSITMIF